MRNAHASNCAAWAKSQAILPTLHLDYARTSGPGDLKYCDVIACADQ
jgi:hypothetical protein